MTAGPPITHRPTADLAAVLATIVEGLRANYADQLATHDNLAHLSGRITAELHNAADRGDLARFGVQVREDIITASAHAENVMTANGERTRVWFDFAGTPLAAHTEPA